MRRSDGMPKNMPAIAAASPESGTVTGNGRPKRLPRAAVV